MTAPSSVTVTRAARAAGTAALAGVAGFLTFINVSIQATAGLARLREDSGWVWGLVMLLAACAPLAVIVLSVRRWRRERGSVRRAIHRCSLQLLLLWAVLLSLSLLVIAA